MADICSRLAGPGLAVPARRIDRPSRKQTLRLLMASLVFELCCLNFSFVVLQCTVRRQYLTRPPIIPGICAIMRVLEQAPTSSSMSQVSFSTSFIHRTCDCAIYCELQRFLANFWFHVQTLLHEVVRKSRRRTMWRCPPLYSTRRHV